LFFIDLYLSDSDVDFMPPAPFTRDEMDERGILPERVYAKDELLAYLRHGREKCRTTIAAMTDEKASRRCGFDWLDLSVGEMLLYNLRHVQHHTGQLNLILRQKTDSAPRWIRKTTTGIDE
jgi:uncharacterized damage-inducible protein DinB